jgi:peroxiredoxin
MTPEEDYFPAAPELVTSEWFNSEKPIKLSDLRGKVVVIEAFQMLCPGCVAQGLPQAQQVHATFPKDKVAVLGLHTVFEHHEAMKPVSLEAFIHEYGLRFPIGVDEADGVSIPKTMRAYGMQGTPSLILIDQHGRLRAHQFGQIGDMHLAYQITSLMHEGAAPKEVGNRPATDGCDEEGCAVR